MATAYVPNNEGIGANCVGTFLIDPTAGQDFSQTDLDANLSSCSIDSYSATPTVSMGAAGGRLLGKVLALSSELQAGTAVPVWCTVQMTGVARFKYVATTPVIGNKVMVDGAGAVKQATTATDVAAGGTVDRGLVIAVYSATTECDVLLDA